MRRKWRVQVEVVELRIGHCYECEAFMRHGVCGMMRLLDVQRVVRRRQELRRR
jgi:hypothetical protein